VNFNANPKQLDGGKLNYAEMDFAAPFGGYKQSGNGREWGEVAFGEFLETEAIVGSRKAA
jgi:aldehyde dehydrogenase (NAD+)